MNKQTKILLSILGIVVVGAIVLASSNSEMFQGRMSRNVIKSQPPVNAINPFYLTRQDFIDLMARKKIYIKDEISYLTMKSSDSTTPILRAEGVKVLMLAYENIKGPSLIPEDVLQSPSYTGIGTLKGDTGTWYYKFIQEGVYAGILTDPKPWDGNDFRPMDPLTKDEAYAMINNLAKVLK